MLIPTRRRRTGTGKAGAADTPAGVPAGTSPAASADVPADVSPGVSADASGVPADASGGRASAAAAAGGSGRSGESERPAGRSRGAARQAGNGRRSEASFEEVRERFAEEAGRIAGLYGVNPLLGRLYAVLLMAPRPMSLDEVTDAAGSAKSTASVALRNLEKYRLVVRHWRKSDRRTFYEARVDLASMLSEWQSLFVSPDLERARSLCIEASRAVAETAAGGEEGFGSEEARALQARVGGVAAWLGRALEALSDGALAGFGSAEAAARDAREPSTAQPSVAAAATEAAPGGLRPRPALLSRPRRLTIELAGAARAETSR